MAHRFPTAAYVDLLMKAIRKYVDMEIMCDAQIKKKEKIYPQPNIERLAYFKWNKTVLHSVYYVIKPEGQDRTILVLAKQEQNNATVFWFYVLVLFNEIRAASLCHDTQPKVCKYMKERRPIKTQYASMTSPQSVKF